MFRRLQQGFSLDARRTFAKLFVRPATRYQRHCDVAAEGSGEPIEAVERNSPAGFRQLEFLHGRARNPGSLGKLRLGHPEGLANRAHPATARHVTWTTMRKRTTGFAELAAFQA